MRKRQGPLRFSPVAISLAGCYDLCIHRRACTDGGRTISHCERSPTMKKKIFALALALSLLLGVTAASAEAVTYPIGDGSQTLSWWIPMNGNLVTVMQSYNEHPIYQQLMKDTGVNINFTHPAAGQESEEFGLMLVSGELPDIIQTFRTTTRAAWPPAMTTRHPRPDGSGQGVCAGLLRADLRRRGDLPPVHHRRQDPGLLHVLGGVQSLRHVHHPAPGLAG